jgi:thioredoxin reductase (NADPH)
MAIAKPVIFTVDDDPVVLRAIERDLRRQYGKDYRVLRADSGQAALSALQQIRVREEPVALVLSDQRMPEMTGVEFLEKTRELFPEAKRALLTAYADTDAAIRAINRVQVDYYLLKPWDPPDEKLYPVIDDLLDEWLASYRPKFAGIRVVGPRWSASTHEVKDFLARNQVPYKWLDIEASADAQQLVEHFQVATNDLPLVLFDDGSHLVKPGNAELAEKVGLKTRVSMPFYDLIIVGAGPAGLAAAVYGASEGLATLLIERSAPGGQAGQSSRIENYLGFDRGVSGSELTRRAVFQAERFGAEILRPQEVTALRTQSTYHVLTLTDGTELSCHALIIATGVNYRKLDVPGLDHLTGMGVYYGAAITEAISCRNSDVYVVGGGNSAGQAAVYLSKYANNVGILCRGDSLGSSMSQYLVEQIGNTHNIIVRACSQVVGVTGENNLQSITVRDINTGQEETLPASALFIFIGAEPHTEWCGDVLQRDDHGFILTGPDLMRDGKRPKGWPLEREPYFLESSTPGIFVAGDVRQQSIKRVASAVGEGAMAVAFTHKYLASL